MFNPEDLFKIVSVENFDVRFGRVAVVCYENRPVARILSGFGENWLDSSVKIELGELFAESVKWSPSGCLLIEADRGGAERRSIYIYDNGSLTPIISDGYDNVEYTPSLNGKQAAFLSNREGETMHLYVHEAQSIRRVSLGNLPVEGFAWSPDSRFIVYSQGIYDNDLWVYDSHSGHTSKLFGLPASEQHVFEDGWGEQGLLVASNHADTYQVGVIPYDKVRAVCEGEKEITDANSLRWLTNAKWDVVEAAWYNEDLVYVENCDGDHTLKIGEHKVLSSGVISTLKVSDNTLYFTRSTHDRDNDLYMVDNKFGVHRLTDSMSQVKAQFVEPKHIEYTSRDLKIHALLYDAGGKRGAVYIHGGPDYQSMNTFNPTIQLLVQRGFTVIAPNYRGSTGYGRRFNHLNDGDLGGGDLI
ncbi:MAG: prolyl oligopeptidase family serine peptidase, partial [Thermoprotei archaeon]